MYLKNYLYIFLFSLNIVAQDANIIGKVKSINENLIYLEEQPKIPENCLDCDINSLYQFGIATVGSPDIYDILFEEDWQNSRYVKYKNREQKFNQEGLKTVETWFEGNNSVYRKFEYKYDENDSITQIKEYYDDTNNVIIKKNYLNDLLISEIYFTMNEDNNNNYSYKYYSYDESKNLIQIKKFNENGFDFSSHYTYNEMGKQIQLNNSHSDDEKILVWKKIYDEKNRLIELQNYSTNEYTKKDSIVNRFVMKYNDNNKIIQRKYIVTGYEIEYNFEYDANNNIKRFYTNSFSKPNNYEFSYFRKKSRLVKVISKKYNENFTITFDYKDDEKGNWIEQTKSVNGKPMFIWKRKIEYYN